MSQVLEHADTTTVARLKPPRVGPGCAGIVMTPEEFDDLPEHRWVPGYRYELINGVLIVSPPAPSAERSPNDHLGRHLLNYQEQDPHGPSLDDTLPEHTIPSTPNRRRCDRAIWAGLGRQPTDEDVPTIVVEFVSRSKSDKDRDYRVKREEYRVAGVKEYWIIDRFRRLMTAIQYRPEGAFEVVTPDGGTYQTALLPGFTLHLSRLLGRADKWPTPKRRRRPKAGGSR